MGADLSYGIYSWLCSTFTEKPITGNNLTANPTPHKYWSDLLRQFQKCESIDLVCGKMRVRF
jgi:hypothetical protein